MSKENKMPLGQKIAYGAATIGVAGALVFGGVAMSAIKDKKAANADLATKDATITSLQSQLNNQEITIDSFKEQIESLGMEVVELKDVSAEDKAVIADYEAENAKLVEELENIEVTIEVEANGYSVEKSISAFDLGELNDNQFEKLGDYEVSFDGDKISVEEFLNIKGDFNVEGDVSLMFAEDDVQYKLTFDKGLDFAEDDLELSILGKTYDITKVEDNKLYLSSADKEFVGEGAEIQGIKVLRIAEDAVIVSDGVDTEVLNKDDEAEFGDLTVKLESIFYDDGEGSLAVLRVGEDLNKVIEVGDYADDDEMWKFLSIDDGEIVISLAEDVEEVSELVLPNDFATIGFKLTDEDYNKVEVSKDDNKLEEVIADFENYDANKVEFNGSDWIIEDDNGDDLVVTSLELKDSVYNIDFTDDMLVTVAGIDVTPNDVNVSGDEDEAFTTEEGIVVSERDSWNEDDDDSVVIEVPEEAVEAKILVE